MMLCSHRSQNYESNIGSDDDHSTENFNLRCSQVEMESQENEVVREKRKPGSNGVWSSILDEEQMVSQLNGLNKQDLPCDSQKRECEAYDYTKSSSQILGERNSEEYIDGVITENDYDDLFQCDQPVPDLDVDKKSTCHKKQHTSKKHSSCKKSVKSRLGNRAPRRNFDIRLSKLSSIDETSVMLAERLREPKVQLINRVVNTIGTDRALTLLGMTEDIEASGGLMTNNGQRKRTLGGVFLMLLKSEKNITKEELDSIFYEENKILQKKKKLNKKRYRQKQLKSKKSQAASIASENCKLDDNSPNQVDVIDDDEMEAGEIKD